jgi:hypothetical protein
MVKQWSIVATGLLLSLASGLASATAQQPDILLRGSKELALNTNPLVGWLQAHPDRKLARGSQWTSNWRGYVGTWEIAKGALWLKKVEVAFPDPKKHKDRKDLPTPPDPSRCAPGGYRELVCDQTTDLFPEGGPVRADWYTGTLIVPTGELVDYVHMGYGSTYSRYLVVWVRAGDVVRELDLTDKQFTELRRERFKAYQQTEAYKKQLAESRKQLGERAEDFLYQYHAEEYLSAELGP